MGKMRRITEDLCNQCVYRCRICNFGHNGRVACNYLDIMGESRIFVKGKKVIPAGYCDKFKYGKESQTVSDKWKKLF